MSSSSRSNVKPRLLGLSEIASRKSHIRGHFLIHLNKSQWKNALRGIKIKKTKVPRRGIDFIPLAYGGGLIDPNLCGPGQVPIILPDGNSYCKSEEGKGIEDPFPRSTCKYIFNLKTGEWQCSGTCGKSGALRCIKAWWVIPNGYRANCICPILTR